MDCGAIFFVMTAAERRLAITCTILILLVTLSSSMSFAAAKTLPYSTDVFTTVGSPVAPWTCPVCVQITYQNNNDSQATGIIYGTYHNSLGQTVRMTTATITLMAGGTATAYLAGFGLPPGQYLVDVFVITPSGIAISAVSTLKVNG